MLDPILGGSLISAGAGLLGNALNVGSVIQTNQAQKDLAKYQVDLERQLINEQNAYNSEVSKMARYQEAGLNPNLIYGNGSSSANQNAIARYNAPNLEAPRFDLSSLGNMLQAGFALKKAKSDSDASFFNAGYAQEQVRKLRNENRVYEVLTGQLGEGVHDKGVESSRYMNRYQAEVSALELGNDLKEGQKVLNSLSADEKKFYNEKILPLVLSGHDLSNQRLQQEVDLYKAAFGVNAASRLLSVLALFLKVL